MTDLRHHDGRGKFRNPWQNHLPRLGDLVQFARESRQSRDDTPPGSFPVRQPNPTQPHAGPEQLSITWVGHSTFLIQLGNRNILTDPMWGERASPVSFAGPRRFMQPGLAIADLPPIDAVFVSHNHYDHLDAGSVRHIADAHPNALWIAPLGVTRLLAGLGAQRITECDWWESRRVLNLDITAVPAQHFSGRSFRRNESLWCGWVFRSEAHSCYFVGDTGWFPEIGEAANRCGPFDVIFMPIGAYEPRWFMSPVHVNPQEAVDAFAELTRGQTQDRACVMVAMHWGTFRLTTEPMTEPPERVREAWVKAGLDERHLWILDHGETRWVHPTGR